MTPKSSRFMNLERSRSDRSAPQEPARLQSGNRFETLTERAGAPLEAAVPETHLGRFRGQAPLALEDTPEEAERFPRCGSCQSDNGRYATECAMCGADLTTPQQRAFNEQLWARRKQELAQEREATAPSKERERGLDSGMEDLKRKLEEVRKAGRSGTLGQRIEGQGSIIMGLLSYIPSPTLRGLIVGCLIASVGVVRYVYRLTNRWWWYIPGLIVVFILLAPTGDRGFDRWRR